MDDSNSSQGIGDSLVDEGGGDEKNITRPRLHSQVNAQLKKLHPHPCLKKRRVHSCNYNTHTCKLHIVKDVGMKWSFSIQSSHRPSVLSWSVDFEGAEKTVEYKCGRCSDKILAENRFTSCQKSAATSQPEEDHKSSLMVYKKLGVISFAVATLVKKTGKLPTNHVMNMLIIYIM